MIAGTTFLYSSSRLYFSVLASSLSYTGLQMTDSTLKNYISLGLNLPKGANIFFPKFLEKVQNLL